MSNWRHTDILPCVSIFYLCIFVFSVKSIELCGVLDQKKKKLAIVYWLFGQSYYKDNLPVVFNPFKSCYKHVLYWVKYNNNEKWSTRGKLVRTFGIDRPTPLPTIPNLLELVEWVFQKQLPLWTYIELI